MIPAMAATAQEILRILEENAPAIRRHCASGASLSSGQSRGARHGKDSDSDSIVEPDQRASTPTWTSRRSSSNSSGTESILCVRDVLKPRLR